MYNVYKKNQKDAKRALEGLLVAYLETNAGIRDLFIVRQTSSAVQFNPAFSTCVGF
jgi:hypothetical protein